MAACGLDCGACDLYKASFDISAAESLVEWFKSKGWIGIHDGAAELMEKGPYCCGCQGDRNKHWSGNCAILICCVDERKLEHCAHCDEFPCQRLKEWSEQGEGYQKALNRLMNLG
jgi:hypothetical protein